MKNRARRRSLMTQGDDLDPMNAVSNLFDVAMVFSVALMVALVSYLDVADMLFSDSFTMVKNPGKENMEIVTKENGKIVQYQAQKSDATNQSKGKRVGTAYQLENGEIIYIQDGAQ